MRAWDFGQRFPSNTDTINSRGKPVILAPAMNTAMWYHPLTKNQLVAIRNFASPDAKSNNYHGNAGTGVTIVEPATKTLACGEIGAGALADLDDIMYEVKKCLVQIGLLELLQMTNCDVSCFPENERCAFLFPAHFGYSNNNGVMPTCNERLGKIIS